MQVLKMQRTKADFLPLTILKIILFFNCIKLTLITLEIFGIINYLTKNKYNQYNSYKREKFVQNFSFRR